MKRIIVMVLKNIIFVPYYWIMLNWYAAHVDKYTEEQRYAMLKKIDHAANRDEPSDRPEDRDHIQEAPDHQKPHPDSLYL